MCLFFVYWKFEVVIVVVVERGWKEEGKELDYCEFVVIRVYKLGFLILFGMYIEDIVFGGVCVCVWDCGWGWDDNGDGECRVEGVWIGLGLYCWWFWCLFIFVLVLVFGIKGGVVVIESEGWLWDGICGKLMLVGFLFFLLLLFFCFLCFLFLFLLFIILNCCIGFIVWLNGLLVILSVMGNVFVGVCGYIGLSFGFLFFFIFLRGLSDGLEREIFWLFI